MLLSDNLRKQFNTWATNFDPFITSKEFDKIFIFLKAQSTAKKKIIPKSADLFTPFTVCDMNRLKAVLIFQEPYNLFNKKEEMLATGVPLSCNTGTMEDALLRFYEGIEEQYLGFSPEMWLDLDTTYLLQDGVLLLNSSFTVEKEKPGSHLTLWNEFMKFFIQEIVNKKFNNLPILLYGAQAQKLEQYIDTTKHHVLRVEHMGTAVALNRKWNYNNCFRFCDDIIEKYHGLHKQIRWYKTLEDRSKTYPAWVYKAEKETKLTEDLGLPWE